MHLSGLGGVSGPRSQTLRGAEGWTNNNLLAWVHDLWPLPKWVTLWYQSYIVSTASFAFCFFGMNQMLASLVDFTGGEIWYRKLNSANMAHTNAEIKEHCTTGRWNPAYLYPPVGGRLGFDALVFHTMSNQALQPPPPPPRLGRCQPTFRVPQWLRRLALDLEVVELIPELTGWWWGTSGNGSSPRYKFSLSPLSGWAAPSKSVLIQQTLLRILKLDYLDGRTDRLSS